MFDYFVNGAIIEVHNLRVLHHHAHRSLEMRFCMKIWPKLLSKVMFDLEILYLLFFEVVSLLNMCRQRVIRIYRLFFDAIFTIFRASRLCNFSLVLFCFTNTLAVFHLVHIVKFFNISMSFKSHIWLFWRNRFHFLVMLLIFSKTRDKIHVRVVD